MFEPLTLSSQPAIVAIGLCLLLVTLAAERWINPLSWAEGVSTPVPGTDVPGLRPYCQYSFALVILGTLLGLMRTPDNTHLYGPLSHLLSVSGVLIVAACFAFPALRTPRLRIMSGFTLPNRKHLALVAVAVVTALLAAWVLGRATAGADSVGDTEVVSDGGYGAAQLVVMLASTGIVVPLLEEIVYRGVMQKSLTRKLGHRNTWLSVLCTAATFACVHAVVARPESLVTLFVVGIVVGVVYEKTGSLLSCWMVHAAYNCILLVYATWPAIAG